jgi:hypothetical protein
MPTTSSKTPGAVNLSRMTGLLEKALRRIESLSPAEQDTIAAQILESIDDDIEWMQQLHQRPELLRRLAKEAVEEHRRGETRLADDLLNR